jgi:hypothetical protein
VGLPENIFDSLSIASRHFYSCHVHAKEGVVFEPADKAALLSQMDRLIREIDRRWVGGCYYPEGNFRAYHVVQKYIRAIQFAPNPGDGGPRGVRMEIARPSSHSQSPGRTAENAGMQEANASEDLKIVPMMQCGNVGFLPTDLPFGVSLRKLPELMRALRPLPCALCGGRHSICIPLGRLPGARVKVVLRLRLKADEHAIHTRQAGWVKCDHGGNLSLCEDGNQRTAEEFLSAHVKEWWFEAEAAA